MLNYETILSSYDNKLTLLQWLKAVEDALENDALSGVSGEWGSASLKLTYSFADGTSKEFSIALPANLWPLSTLEADSAEIGTIDNVVTLTAQSIDADTISATGDVHFDGNIYSDNDLSVSGSATIGEDLNVSGTITAGSIAGVGGKSVTIVSSSGNTISLYAVHTDGTRERFNVTASQTIDDVAYFYFVSSVYRTGTTPTLFIYTDDGSGDNKYWQLLGDFEASSYYGGSFDNVYFFPIMNSTTLEVDEI